METFKKCQKAVGTPRDKAAKRMEIKARRGRRYHKRSDADISTTENTAASDPKAAPSAMV